MDTSLCQRGGVDASPDAVEVGDNFDAEFCSSGGGGISCDQYNDESDAESGCYRRMDDKSDGDDDDDDGDSLAEKGEVRNCMEWAAWEEEEHGDDDEEQQEDHDEEEERGRRDAREDDRAFWRACLAYGYP